MATMMLKAGQKRLLPGQVTWQGGLGWKAKQVQGAGTPASVDLDLWLIRVNAAGVGTPVFWGNADWWREDLGFNVVRDENGVIEKDDKGAEKHYPWIASPELDVIHKGDDPTGGSSASGYDEKFELSFARTPADVVSYHSFATIYDPENAGLTLGVAEDVVCGVVDSDGHEMQAQIEMYNSFDVSAYIAKWERDPDSGLWTMTSMNKGFQTHMWDVAESEFKCEFPTRWQEAVNARGY